MQALYGIETAVAQRLQAAERLLVEPEASFSADERLGIRHLAWERSGHGELAFRRPAEAWGRKGENLAPTQENPGFTQILKELQYELEIPKWTLVWGWLSPTGPILQCPEFTLELCGRVLDGSIKRFRTNNFEG